MSPNDLQSMTTFVRNANGSSRIIFADTREMIVAWPARCTQPNDHADAARIALELSRVSR